MDVIVDRCAGLDVHKKSVTACVRTPGRGSRRRKELRTFATFSDSLRELAAWLTEDGVTVVAMEATGVFWKPIFWVLEDAGFELLLVNATHVKKVPGRKTDVKDAEWLAQLLECGLLRGSFVPPKPIRELRDLTGTASGSSRNGPGRRCGSTRSSKTPASSWRRSPPTPSGCRAG